MNPDEELKRLQDRAATLEDAVKDLDYQIERAMHAVAGGTDDVGRAMMLLTERRNTQLGLMFELGKVTARIDDLENRARERIGHDVEVQSAQDWNAEKPASRDDHLDWLRPSLDQSGDGATDMHTQERDGQQPDRHLDWLDKR